MTRLAPTHGHHRADHYLRPGGPWDVPNLDGVLGGAEDRADLIVDSARRWSSAEVRDAAARLAGGLRERGVAAGDVVAWQAPNRAETIVLLRACWKLGAVAAPVHHLFGARELDHVLDQVQPRLALASDGMELAARSGTLVLGGAQWAELTSADPLPGGEADAGAVAAVIFTSGSSGTPKGVLHTHRTLGAKAVLMRRVHGLSPDDAVLMPAPLAHVSGLLNGVLVPGAVPMKTVLMERWNAEAALDIVESEAITFMVGPPTFFVAMMESPAFAPERVRSLRLVSSGGAGVTPAFVDKAGAALGAVVKRTYGSTEAPTVTTSHEGDDATGARETDGRVTGEAELRVVDPATGKELPAGEPGELWVRGPEVCAGYVDETITAEAFTADGWFRTGDLATVSADGWLTIVGRLKDVIIRGGENISASEVEGVLEAHPAVRQAVAVGYPDDRLGERVAAFVVCSEPFDLAACQAWFESRGVARFKTPERIEQVAALPLLPTGKPDRAALRALLA